MFTFHYGMPLPKFHLDIPQRNMDVFRRMRNPMGRDAHLDRGTESVSSSKD